MHSTFIVNMIMFFWQQIKKKIKFLPKFPVVLLLDWGVEEPVWTGASWELSLFTGKYTVN